MNPQQLSNDALKALIEFCRDRRGGFEYVREQFAKKSGTDRSLTTFRRWLNEDDAARLEPRFGEGLVLQIIAREMLEKDPGLPPKKDQFSDLPVSRERKRQLRRNAEGKCLIGSCKGAAFKGGRCKKHALEFRKQRREANGVTNPYKTQREILEGK